MFMSFGTFIKKIAIPFVAPTAHEIGHRNLSTLYFNTPNPHQQSISPLFNVTNCGYLIHFSILDSPTFIPFLKLKINNEK